MPTPHKARRPRVRVTRSDFETLQRLMPSAPEEGSALALLDDELARATVIETATSGAFSRLGDWVIYEDCMSGQVRQLRLVLPGAADTDTHHVSVLTPVGAALLGLAPGSLFDWTDHRGRLRRLNVLRVLSERDPDARACQAVGA